MASDLEFTLDFCKVLRTEYGIVNTFGRAFLRNVFMKSSGET